MRGVLYVEEQNILQASNICADMAKLGYRNRTEEERDTDLKVLV